MSSVWPKSTISPGLAAAFCGCCGEEIHPNRIWCGLCQSHVLPPVYGRGDEVRTWFAQFGTDCPFDVSKAMQGSPVLEN